MLLMRFVFVIAMFAIIAPVASVRKQTTAVWSDGH